MGFKKSKDKQALTQDSKDEQLMRFRAAIDGAQTPIIMVDRDLVVTYFNEATRKMLKTHANAMRSIWPDFDPDIMGKCIDFFHKDPSHQRRLLADPSNLPHRADIEVGDLKFALTVSAQFDSNRNYVGNTLEWQDVTELRQKEITNLRYENQMVGIDRSSAVIEFDLDGTIRDANENFCKVMGYTPEEIIGQHHRIFCRDEFRNSSEYQRFWELLRSGDAHTGEFERVGKNGESVWIQAAYSPICDEHGKIQTVMKVASDITASKRHQVTTEKVLKEAASVMGCVAAGDLSPRMTEGYTGIFGEVAAAINSCVDKLTDVVQQIVVSADAVSRGAAEISDGNNNLSARTEQQASNLEETASSMEEMTATVRQNADHAGKASGLATGTQDQAGKGQEVINQAVEAMAKINDSSSRIADIIGVIDEIAFQTNLLALNASVEAARAGDQGRGFAVVASEVRDLAGRSATAAKEIKSLIEESVTNVGEGKELVDASGETLREIVNSIGEVSEIVGQIAGASKEQADGIDQVNSAISKMDEMTQQNAALVEEAASASSLMGSEAGQLKDLVGFFRTG